MRSFDARDGPCHSFGQRQAFEGGGIICRGEPTHGREAMEVRHLEPCAVGENHGPFQRVLELSDIARPGLRHEEFACLWEETLDLSSEFDIEAIKEVVDKLRDIVDALAQ